MQYPKPEKKVRVDTDAPPTRCKVCGAKVWFIRKVNGALSAHNRDGTRHKCGKSVI
jgi:hypothetical protein